MPYYMTDDAKSYFSFLLASYQKFSHIGRVHIHLLIYSTSIDCLLQEKVVFDICKYTGFGKRQHEFESLPCELFVV